MKQFLLLTVSIIFLGVLTTAAQSIAGTVVSTSTKDKLQGAFVTLISRAKTTYKKITDADGKFVFKNTAAGDYDIVVEYVGYTKYTNHLHVAGENIELAVQLTEGATALTTVNIFSKVNGEKETGSRSQEKNATNVINVISAQAMQRSPDINAANVLQRMSGVTIQRNAGADEAYSIVRGLEPRYNNTLINGIKIASPDDKSRFVSLNVVPSDLLQKIEVSKTLLPEMEGDAIGGTVNLVMKDAPDSTIIRAIGSLGYSTLLWDRAYTSFSKTDIQQKSLYERFGEKHVAQPTDFSRSNLDFKSTSFVPTGTLGVTYGHRYLKNKVGLLIAENFQNQYYGTNSIFNQVTPDPNKGIPVYSDYSLRYFSTQQLNNGLTTHLDYNINDKNKIIINNVFLYSYLAQARTIIDTAILGGNGGRTVPGTGPVTTDYTSTTTHQFIENLKLEGRHILSQHFLFDWAGVLSLATRRAPDRANLAINTKIDTVHTTNDPNGPYTFKRTPNYFDQISRIWQHNNDKDYDAIGNLTYKTQLSVKTSLDIKAGGLYRHKTRYNIQDEYDLKPTTNSNGVKQVFTDIYSAGWIVYDTHGTQAYDINNYQLFEDISAGYMQFKFASEQLDVFGGARFEKTKQGYKLNTFYPTGINGVTKDYSDWLPSITIKYKATNKINIRASYYRSIARPNYYELVPALSYSSSSANISQGNPYLKHSIADNYDVRLEFFPKNEEQLFIGGFYKKLTDPIEYAYLNGTTYQPVNDGDATVYGAELVYTKYFGKHIGITGNYTFIHSNISSIKAYTDVVARTTHDSLQQRPLQGQTDNTLNLSLLYRNDKSGFFAQLSYEYIGKTLALVYPVYGFDYYQRPQSFLALSAEKSLANKHFTVFGKFNNLLNTATVNKINTLLTVSDTYNLNISLGIRYSN